MFCGKFSLFRDTTKRHLSKLEDEYKDKLELMQMLWEDFDPYTKLQESLLGFFNKKGLLELIVTSDLSSIEEEESWPDLKKAITDGRMKVWQYDNAFSLDHFSVAGSAYRIENSDAEKTAICCFNDLPTANELIESFDSIKENSRLLPIA